MWPLQVLLQVRNAIDDDFIGSRWHDWRWASRFTTLQLVVSEQFLSKTALRILIIFCMKVPYYKGKKLTQPFFRKSSGSLIIHENGFWPVLAILSSSAGSFWLILHILIDGGVLNYYQWTKFQWWSNLNTCIVWRCVNVVLLHSDSAYWLQILEIRTCFLSIWYVPYLVVSVALCR